MNDERFLKDWLGDTTDKTSNPQAAADKVMAKVPHKKQRHRWWPLLPSRRSRPNEDTPPTITRRTKFMLSPVKAITAGALVFALGGAFLISQPFGQQEANAPAPASAELAEPVEFTARFSPSSSVRVGTYEVVDGVTQQRGNAWTPAIFDMTEPRLDGTLTYSEDADSYPGLHDFGTATYRIENDDGAWQGSTSILTVGGSYDSASVVVLVGEGAYAGLYAWMDASDWSEISGVIFPAPPPEAPVPPEMP